MGLVRVLVRVLVLMRGSRKGLDKWTIFVSYRSMDDMAKCQVDVRAWLGF